MRSALAFDAIDLTCDPVRAIEAAHQLNAPPVGATFLIPTRTLDFGQAGSVRVSLAIRAPHGLARLEVTRRGACVVMHAGLTMLGLTSGSLWLWSIAGKRCQRVWLWPDCNALTPRRPRRPVTLNPLDSAHTELVALYRLFGLVWTGDQSLPAKPYRMTIARYDKLIGKIREQWAVLSGR